MSSQIWLSEVCYHNLFSIIIFFSAERCASSIFYFCVFQVQESIGLFVGIQSSYIFCSCFRFLFGRVCFYCFSKINLLALRYVSALCCVRGRLVFFHTGSFVRPPGISWNSSLCFLCFADVCTCSHMFDSILKKVDSCVCIGNASFLNFVSQHLYVVTHIHMNMNIRAPTGRAQRAATAAPSGCSP